jgi:hypothetical protein
MLIGGSDVAMYTIVITETDGKSMVLDKMWKRENQPQV